MGTEWPCPLMAMEGNINPLGLVAALSNNVPDWANEGATAKLPIWYHLAPLRRPAPEVAPVPAEVTAMA